MTEKQAQTFFLRLQHIEGQIAMLMTILSEQAALLGDRNLTALEQKVRDIAVQGGGVDEPKDEGRRYGQEFVLNTLRTVGKWAREDSQSQPGGASSLGYFDGRQLAAETAVGLLMVLLEKPKRQALGESLTHLRKQFSVDPALTPEAARGFDDFLERLRNFLKYEIPGLP